MKTLVAFHRHASVRIWTTWSFRAAETPATLTQGLKPGVNVAGIAVEKALESV